MMVFASLLAAFAAFEAVSASALIQTRSPATAHESVTDLPKGWSFHSDAGRDDLITLRIALKNKADELLELAEAVGNPDANQYGQHLSADKLTELITPHTSGACDTVSKWLQSHGADDMSCDGNYARFSTFVGKADYMLSSQFGYYQFDNREPVLRTKSYSLPAHLDSHVDFVFPTVHFLTSSRKERFPSTLEPRQHGIPTGPITCTDGTSVCPQNLTARYNITHYPKDDTSGSKIGVTGFIDNFPNGTDVHNFFAKYGLKNQSHIPTYKIQSIRNGTTKIPEANTLSVEPNLDLDYTLAFTGPLPATFYTTGGHAPLLKQPGNKPAPANDSDNEPYLDFFTALLAEKNPPQVISISYSDDEQSVPIKYAQHVCNLIMQATTRGITVIGSSGDGGAQGTGNSDCVGPNGKRRFIPTFPSSCPWITSVGAVAPYGGPASYSSGGFSNYFARPSWQDTAVKQYVKELNGSHAGYYNASGRGIPDVSLLGDNYLILAAGYAQTQKGTSASTPVFAAMIALLNDLRLRAGKPVLGHLNPLLYSGKFASALRDVVSEFGTSRGCSDGDFVEGGWEALKGWDAATGLGEPNFAKLRALLV